MSEPLTPAERVRELEEALRALLPTTHRGYLRHFETPQSPRYMLTRGKCWVCNEVWPCAGERARAALREDEG